MSAAVRSILLVQGSAARTEERLQRMAAITPELAQVRGAVPVKSCA